MRLWSLHPKYLDPKGLVALWREGLLAQAVLADQTRGYKHHPQLTRFRESPDPKQLIAVYLQGIYAEALHRGYCFDVLKIGRAEAVQPLIVSRGQLEYEWAHLTHKLKLRAATWLTTFENIQYPEPHTLFKVVDGGIARWEAIAEHNDVRPKTPPPRSKNKIVR